MEHNHAEHVVSEAAAASAGPWDSLSAFFSQDGFMPHGHCYLWQPSLVWTMVVTDALIGLAYFSISLSLYLLIRKIKIPFSAMFIAFGLFIGACGVTHFMEIYNLWYPDYWSSAGVKVITAMASVATAVLMFPIRPKIEAVASAARLSEERRLSLESLTSQLEHKVELRTQELTRAVESRDDFLSIASHELKTPITSLKMHLQILNRSINRPAAVPPDLAELREVVSLSLEQTGRLTRLIEELLDVSRIRSGQLHYEFANMDLTALIHSVLEKLDSQIRESRNQLSLTSQGEVRGNWDRARLEQVVTNLVSNCLRYAPGTPVEISLEKTKGHAVLRVKDAGPGIASDRLESVFHRFERASTKNTGGLGLGLYIVNEIVRGHNGRVWVESKVGEGSTFVVEIPLEATTGAGTKPDPSAEGGSNMSDSAPGNGQYAILIVEDDYAIRSAFYKLLQGEGYQVFSAENGQEAINFLRAKTQEIDLILLDLMMPVKDGFEFREEQLLDPSLSAIPVIVMSADGRVDEKQRITKAAAYLRKPVEINHVLDTIEKFLAA